MLTIGMRVTGIDRHGNPWSGTIHSLSGSEATIKRDDGKGGGGEPILESPYHGTTGWVVFKEAGIWRGDGVMGIMTIGTAPQSENRLLILESHYIERPGVPACLLWIREQTHRGTLFCPDGDRFKVGNFCVISAGSPDLNSDYLYVRGNNAQYDDQPILISGNKIADTIARIKDVVSNYNMKFGGGKLPAPQLKNSIYTYRVELIT